MEYLVGAEGIDTAPVQTHLSPTLTTRAMIARALIALTLLASFGRAQTPPSATSQARMLWQGVRRNVSAAAEEGSETLYSYRPTVEVRTFGQLLAHVAGSEKMFCAMSLGEKPGAEDQVEKTAMSKAAIVAALKESYSYCNRAYAQSDAATAASIEMFGETRTKLFALMMNAAHDDEHYGNLVTYMRLNKLVPPSSRPTPPK